MGFYYTNEPPPEPPRRGWQRFIPGWLRSFGESTAETFMVTSVVFGAIMPIFGALLGFVVLLAFLVFLMGQCSGG